MGDPKSREETKEENKGMRTKRWSNRKDVVREEEEEEAKKEQKDKETNAKITQQPNPMILIPMNPTPSVAPFAAPSFFLIWSIRCPSAACSVM